MRIRCRSLSDPGGLEPVRQALTAMRSNQASNFDRSLGDVQPIHAGDRIVFRVLRLVSFRRIPVARASSRPTSSARCWTRRSVRPRSPACAPYDHRSRHRSRGAVLVPHMPDDSTGHKDWCEPVESVAKCPGIFVEADWAQNWRRGWDSNPRDACTPNGFQDRCLQPLGHLSSSRRIAASYARRTASLGSLRP